MSEDSYLRHFSAQISQIMFLASLTVLRLLQLYELKCQNTYISSISVHKFKQNVFSAYLTALPLITTVCVEISENSYLRELSVEVS